VAVVDVVRRQQAEAAVPVLGVVHTKRGSWSTASTVACSSGWSAHDVLVGRAHGPLSDGGGRLDVPGLPRVPGQLGKLTG
jgi:hypothetical protein